MKTAGSGVLGATLRQVMLVTVEGRVQGVGYRHFVRRAASRHNVAGWVRNLANGAVEAKLYGDPQELEAMLCEMRAGPPGAKVEDLRAVEAEGVEDSFLILPTC
jgi:acylphosphatase